MPKKKLRVLMLSWEYPPNVVGGLGAHVAALAPALARTGVQVQVVTPRWKGGESQEPLLADANAARAKTRTRKRVLPPSVFRVEPPVMGFGNFLPTRSRRI